MGLGRQEIEINQKSKKKPLKMRNKMFKKWTCEKHEKNATRKKKWEI